MTQIIAFTGKRGSGKNTAAQALTEIGFKEMAFADPLREILMLVYGLTLEELNDPILKEKPLDRFPWRSPRDLMTVLGTQGFRDLVHQDTWVKALERRALQYTNVVVTDVRFLTEAAMLKKNNAIIIRVVNPNRVDTDEVSQHRSETEMDAIVPHVVIVNDGTIGQLHLKIINVLYRYGICPLPASNSIKEVKAYRKISSIDAVQLCWRNWSEICDFTGDLIGPHNRGRQVETFSDTCGELSPYIELSIPTLEGTMIARHGDWIAKGHDGEFWAIKPDIFQKTYECISS